MAKRKAPSAAASATTLAKGFRILLDQRVGSPATPRLHSPKPEEVSFVMCSPDPVKHAHDLGYMPKDELLKRKRGRPRKGQEVQRPRVVSRRLKRIESNPAVSLRAVAQPKPLKYKWDEPAVAGQKPLAVAAHRLLSERSDGRFGLTTLDVLKQLVQDFAPAAGGELALQEYRMHVLDLLTHLQDLHGALLDMARDVVRIQREKGELRGKIVNLRKQHALVVAECQRLAHRRAENRTRHAEFAATADALERMGRGQGDLAQQTELKLRAYASLFGRRHGIHQQLAAVNDKLAQYLKE